MKKGLTVSAAARMCGVSQQTLDDRIKEGFVMVLVQDLPLFCPRTRKLVWYHMFFVWQIEGFLSLEAWLLCLFVPSHCELERIHIFLSIGQARNGGLSVRHSILT